MSDLRRDHWTIKITSEYKGKYHIKRPLTEDESRILDIAVDWIINRDKEAVHWWKRAMHLIPFKHRVVEQSGSSSAS